MGSAATPNITARLLRLMSFMKILLPPVAAQRPTAASERRRSAEYAKDFT